MAAGSDLLDDVFFNTEVDEKVVSDLVGSLESELSGAAAGRGGGAAAVRGVQSAVNHTGSPAGACGNNNNPDVQGTKMGLLSQQDLAKAAGTGGGVQGGVNNNNTARSHTGGSAVDGAAVAGGTTTSAAVRRLPGSMIMTAAVQQSHAAKTVTAGGVVVSVAAKPGGTPTVQTLNGSNVVLNSHVVPGGGDRGGVGNSLPAGTAVNNGPATTGSPVAKGNVLLATTSNAVIQPSSMPNVIASTIMSPQPAVLNSVPTTTMPGVPATVHGVPTTVPGVPTVTLVRPPMQTPTITSPSGANNPATTVLTTPSVSGPAGTTAMVNRFDSPKTIIQTAGQVAAPVASTGAMSAVKNATVLQNVRTSVPSTVAATCAAGIRAIAPQVLAPRLTQPQQGTPNIQNFQLPPGMVLVRSESGQLLMIHQQALAQTLAQSQSQSAMTPRPATPTSTPPVQITSVQAPGLIARQMSPNCIIKQGSAVQTTVQATTTLQRPPVLQNAIMLGGTASTPGQPLGTPTAMQPGAAATALTQRVPMAPTQISAETLENVKKCKNFLSTLIKLASSGKQSSETTANVKELVKNLLEAKIEAEDFTSRLYRELNSSPQPYLVPFLKRSLPALRQLTPDSTAFIHQSQLPPPTPQPAAAASSALTAVVLRPPLATTTASTAAGTKAPVVSLTQTPHSKPGLVPASQQPGTMVRPQVTLAQSPMVTLRGQSHSRIIMSQPQVVKQLQTTVVKPSLAPGIKAVTGVQSSLNAAQKNKLKEGGGGAFRDDDDINDVASMAGVNLSEESARILATNSELVGTVTRSCKDEAFLSSSLLTRRVLEIGKKFGVGELGPEVINLISHATQQRLQNVLEKVSQVAQQKNITFKEDERHEQISDVRAQLKFFEQLDQMEKQRKEEQEREILMKAAKSRSRQEDPEQLRLKQKAKEMQQHELAQIRQREANLTALAAIGPRKKRKADSPASSASAEGSGSSSSQSGGGSSVGGSRQFTRQRITRVNLRDLLFCLENERGSSHSHLLYRGFLK